MTKFLALIFALLCILALAGCTSDADQPPAQDSAATSGSGAQTEQTNGATPADWGITLKAENVTPTGLTIVCEQSGGENVAELNTGSYFVIQAQKDGVWVNVEYLPQEYDLAWTQEAWGILKDSTTTWNVKWGSLYGELPSGTYRIGKEIMNFRKTGDYDIEMAYAEFTIE